MQKKHVRHYHKWHITRREIRIIRACAIMALAAVIIFIAGIVGGMEYDDYQQEQSWLKEEKQEPIVRWKQDTNKVSPEDQKMIDSVNAEVDYLENAQPVHSSAVPLTVDHDSEPGNTDGYEESETISISKKELKGYFGYVPADWELSYYYATVMAECGYTEPDNGVAAVSDVIANRVKDKRFADTLYGVITEKNQFSTWSNGSVEKYLGKVTDRVRNICNKQIHNGITYDVTFFTAGEYNKYCKPAFIIGHHYFGR